jgi:riboflavin kinase/FMN adenylyltransferase
MLLSLERRLELLMDAGVDQVEVVDFTPNLARMTPDEFMEIILQPLGPTVVMVGENFRFGQGAKGRLDDLAQFGQDQGGWNAFPLTLVNGDDGGVDGSAPVSASRIRALVRVGNVRAAAMLLGRYHELDGPVVHGEKRGRELGMPTANLGLDPGRAIPNEGVYAGWAYVRGERHATAISVGTNPHFTQDHAAPPLTVEAHLLDFDDDIYDEQIRIEFVERTRGQATFASLEDLIQTMQQDVRDVRQLLA